MARWSRGLRHRPFTAVTAVRICYGSPHKTYIGATKPDDWESGKDWGVTPTAAVVNGVRWTAYLLCNGDRSLMHFGLHTAKSVVVASQPETWRVMTEVDAVLPHIVCSIGQVAKTMDSQSIIKGSIPLSSTRRWCEANREAATWGTPRAVLTNLNVRREPSKTLYRAFMRDWWKGHHAWLRTTS